MISMCPMSSTPSSAKICTNVPSGEIQYCGGTCSSQGPLASCCKDTGPNYDLAAGCCPAGYFCCAEEGCGPSGCITHNKGCCPTHYLLQRPRLCHQLNPPAVETASSSGQMILSVVVPTSAACRLKCAVAWFVVTYLHSTAHPLHLLPLCQLNQVVVAIRSVVLPTRPAVKPVLMQQMESVVN